MKRIGVTQRVEVIPARDERRDCLDQRWTELLESAGYLALPLPNRVRHPGPYIAALELQGVILSGGNDLAELNPAHAVPERDRMEAALLEFCGRTRVPLLGVCRGMQFLVASCGGAVCTVERHAGTRHAIETGDDTPLASHTGRVVNSFHDFGVHADGCPEPLRPVAWAEDGSVEAVVHTRLPQMGIMWHPEREGPYREEDIALLRLFFSGTGGV